VFFSFCILDDFQQCCGSGAGIREPVLFWPRNSDPGAEMEKILFFRTKYQFFVGEKYFNFFMQIRTWDLVNPGSGMEKSRIRDKHPGSASLIFSCVYRLLEETRWIPC
jgi:hypothetical protein